MYFFKRTIMTAMLFLIFSPTLITEAHAKDVTSLGYLFGGDASIYLHELERTRGFVNTVNPDYFEVAADGTVKLTKEPDPLFIATMHEKGIKVIPFLSNHWNRELGRLALTQKSTVAQQLAAYITQYDLDGVDIDLQDLTELDREAFSGFVAEIRNKIPSEKIVSACVAANPYSLTKGWHGQYDYKRLGEICDYIFIMTYDESYNGSPAGPVASYSFIEKSIIYALKHVPKEKIMIGVPFYGRYWIAGQAQSSGGKAFTISDIQNLVNNYGTAQWYDAATSCARATLKITASQVNAGLWGGKKLVAGTYDVWYEDHSSFEKKFSLVKKYDIRGAGVWALGQEPQSVWAKYGKWLFGAAFDDVVGHWSEFSVYQLKNTGIINGKTETMFFPEDYLSRAEACVMICKILSLIPPKENFNDLSDTANHWARGYISAVRARGIISGYSDGTFLPDNPISREELASIVAKILHVPDTIDFQDMPFDDVPVARWSSDAILTLKVYKITTGYPNGLFYPLKPVKRAEGASILYELLDKPKVIPPVSQKFDETDYTPIEPR